MRLSEHFTLEELTHSDTAVRLHIDNIPNESQKRALQELTDHILEPTRLLYGKPITISSGFRGTKLNAVIGGATKSQHQTGEAADLVTKDNAKVFEIILENTPFDQLIWEKGWIHVSYSNRNRRQVLQWLGGSKYKDIRKTWKSVVK